MGGLRVGQGYVMGLPLAIYVNRAYRSTVFTSAGSARPNLHDLPGGQHMNTAYCRAWDKPWFYKPQRDIGSRTLPFTAETPLGTLSVSMGSVMNGGSVGHGRLGMWDAEWGSKKVTTVEGWR